MPAGRRPLPLTTSSRASTAPPGPAIASGPRSGPAPGPSARPPGPAPLTAPLTQARPRPGGVPRLVPPPAAANSQ